MRRLGSQLEMKGEAAIPAKWIGKLGPQLDMNGEVGTPVENEWGAKDLSWK